MFIILVTRLFVLYCKADSHGKTENLLRRVLILNMCLLATKIQAYLLSCLSLFATASMTIIVQPRSALWHCPTGRCILHYLIHIGKTTVRMVSLLGQSSCRTAVMLNDLASAIPSISAPVCKPTLMTLLLRCTA